MPIDVNNWEQVAADRPTWHRTFHTRIETIEGWPLTNAYQSRYIAVTQFKLPDQDERHRVFVKYDGQSLMITPNISRYICGYIRFATKNSVLDLEVYILLYFNFKVNFSSNRCVHKETFEISIPTFLSL